MEDRKRTMAPRCKALLLLLLELQTAFASVTLNLESLQTGTQIQLRSIDGRYVCNNGRGELSANRINVAWLHGCTFQVAITSDHKWQLRSMKNGMYVSAEHGGEGAIKAESPQPSGWETFGVSIVGDQVQLKTIRGQWIGMSDASKESRLRAKVTDASGWETFFVTMVPHLYGVSLGSWFVPEKWMTPSLFKVLDGPDYKNLCEMCSADRWGADRRLRTHLDNFFTAADFRWFKDSGVNSVRVPVGYWNVIGDDVFVPSASFSLSKLDQVFDWAAKYNMFVLLDLHSAPSGHIDKNECATIHPGKDWSNHSNRMKSINAIAGLAARYGGRWNLLGFSVLNEPLEHLERAEHYALLEYYKDAYFTVRGYSQTAWVIFNVLNQADTKLWENAFPEPKYYNVVLDLHLYGAFSGPKTEEQLVSDAHGWAERPIAKLQHSLLPVLIGEWSLAAPVNTCGTGCDFIGLAKKFAAAQVSSFTRSLGSFFWSAKFENSNEDRPAWCFIDAVNAGIPLGAPAQNAQYHLYAV